MFPNDDAAKPVSRVPRLDSRSGANHRGLLPLLLGEDAMPLAYWCVLIAALLPIALVSYARAGDDGDNRHPRDTVEGLSAAKRRAYAAHQNAYENFPFFAVAVISATTLGAPIGTVNILAVLYVVARVAHGALYINDSASLRSMAYLVGLLLTIAIFMLPAFK
jgi:uncharacterized MAPEG superfamily protein